MAWCGCAAGAGEHHAPAAAALLARAQLGRVGVGVHEGALSLTAAAQRLRRHRRRRLQGLEPPPRRDRPYHLAVLTPMDHADQTLGALVSIPWRRNNPCARSPRNPLEASGPLPPCRPRHRIVRYSEWIDLARFVGPGGQPSTNAM